MANIIKYIREKFSQLSQNLSLAQKITMLFVFVLAVGFFISLVQWALRPEYTVLFTGLEAADVQEIVEELRAAGVPNKLSDGGKTILVPQKEVYEWRMKFAARDIPATGGIGYEIFDKKDIGVSEFVQHINFRRALEGELARTIQSMAEVSTARVHIVFPKDRLFKEDQKPSTASIFLILRGGAQLRETQIQGISRLVASSVEGLLPDNVTIVDSHGNVISKVGDARNRLAGLSDTQLDLQRRVETHIEGKVQSMLDEVLGRGNAIVRGRVELDFKRIETTSEKYDPDNSAVLSEELEEESMRDSSGAPTNQLERTITNYQLTKSVEHVINNVGDIKRLTVAVVVNGTYKYETNDQGEEVKVYVPRSQDELDRLAAMVRNAIGLDEMRGDKLEIENIEFDTSLLDQQREYFQNITEKERWFNIAERVLTVLGIIFLFFFLRSQFKKAKKSIIKLNQLSGEQPKALPFSRRVRELTIASLEDEIPMEAIEKTTKEQQLLNFVTKKPAVAANLIRYWLMED